MPQIEVVPNSTSVSAPGWAYVPDNGYDPSKVAIQPTGARKRAARTSTLASGDSTTRQQNAVLKHLAELDRDNHHNLHIPVPIKLKDSANKASKSKVTQNVRRILTSQKTFANHLADEEASLASQEQNSSAVGPSRASLSRPAKIGSSRKRSSAGRASTTPSVASQTDTAEASATKVPEETSYSAVQASNEDDPLLMTYVPAAPSDAIMEALLSDPALSYNAARAAPLLGKPQRHFYVYSTLEQCPPYQKLRIPLLSGNMAEIYLCGPGLDFRSANAAREGRNKPLPNPNLDLLTRFERVVNSFKIFGIPDHVQLRSVAERSQPNMHSSSLVLAWGK
ncbi:hypothetical protein MMC29_002830 [Sticta canariensis]|nr:hypothetical protein [Sticta canariensis]